MNDTMHEAWARVQHSLPYALTTQESLWLHPGGTIYLDDHTRYRVLDIGDGHRVEDISGKGFGLPLTGKYQEAIAEHIIADAFSTLKKYSGLSPEQADRCLAPGPLYGAHSLCWFGPGPDDSWGRVLASLDKAPTLDQAIKDMWRGLSALAVEHAFVDLRKTLEGWVKEQVRRGTDDLWLSSMDLHRNAEAMLDLIEDDTGLTRFMVYLTSNPDGSARVRFLDDGGMNYLSFRVGTNDNGLGGGYGDVVDAIRAVLGRLGGRD